MKMEENIFTQMMKKPFNKKINKEEFQLLNKSNIQLVINKHNAIKRKQKIERILSIIS